MSNSSGIPIGAKYLVLGLLIGAVYGVGVSSAWRFKDRRAFVARSSSQASACTLFVRVKTKYIYVCVGYEYRSNIYSTRTGSA